MKITKYEHACFVVEQYGQSLVVDPGHWTTNFEVPNHVVGVVVTHEHGDHFDQDKLKAITDKNPGAVIYAHRDIVSQLAEFRTQEVVANEGMKAGNFELEFFGGEHANITSNWQPVANLGVLVNERLYYPGDSFCVPEERSVEILAIPASAPWMKISEAIDFLNAVKPKYAFPTHDAILSDTGKETVDKWLQSVSEKLGTQYQRIDTTPLKV